MSTQIILPTSTKSQLNFLERETASIFKMVDATAYFQRQLVGRYAAVPKKGKEAKRVDVFGGYWSLLKSSDADLEGMILVSWSAKRRLWGGHNLITSYDVDMDITGKCYLRVS